MTRSTSGEAVRESSASQLGGGIADGCATSGLRPGAKRSISAAQFASSDAGATSRLARLPPSRCFLSTSSSASTCIVLPRPMSSARQAPRPSRRQEVQPAHADLLVGAQRGAGAPRRGRSAPAPRGGEVLERLGQPAAGDDARPVASGASAAAPLGRDVRAGQHAHRLGEGEPALRGRPLDRRNWSSIRRSCSRSTSTQRPRTRCRPSEPASSSAISAPSSRSPSSVTSIWKSSSASVPSPAGALPPTVALTCGRGGRLARHAPGTRTTTPAASSRGRSVSRWNASAGVQRSG